jgi:internalin A
MSEPQPNPAEFSSFADWCLHKKSLSPEARHTVEMLLDEAYTSNSQEANEILLDTNDMDLSNKEISDITPIKYLTNLTWLNLSGNQVSDLTPIKYLTNLTWLNLSDNQVSDLTPLQSLTNLDTLYLDNNLISKITPLQSLTHLTDLRLTDNQISNLTSLNYLNNLENLELSLTPEQRAIFIEYAQKWAVIVNSTYRLDRSQAAATLKAAYITVGLEVPEIIFCSSPHSAITQLKKLKIPLLSQHELIERLYEKIKDVVYLFNLIEFIREIGLEIDERENDIFPIARWEIHLLNEFFIDVDYDEYSSDIVVNRASLAEDLCAAEFFIAEFSMVFSQEIQKALESFKQILAECGWIFAFEKVCYVCSRPSKLSLDSEHRLHAEGEAAIAFSDGYKLYSYHGVTLPEKYGQIHPNQWEASWILEEENAELRRVLIQGIGYARICSELQATDLDSWQEYTLLRIDADIDGFDPEEKEPIYLLKMTCPSTGFIHALRVPPYMPSAREAIRWVNWDVDYEEFSVQT